MADFYQHRLLTTLHHLREPDLGEQASELASHAERRPITLILPALYDEVKQPALRRIVEELKQVDYISHVVVSMNRMTAEELAHAREFFSELPQPHHIIWNDGPRLTALYGALEEGALTSYTPGKGYNVWMAIGHTLARGERRSLRPTTPTSFPIIGKCCCDCACPRLIRTLAIISVKAITGECPTACMGG